jgi:hypothetical protein
MFRIISISFGFSLLLSAVASRAQPTCLHGPSETADQAARRQQALRVTRTVNNIQANQPGSANRVYLRHEDFPMSPFVEKNASDKFIQSLNFTPEQEIIPGWELTVDVTDAGYWFMVKDKTDPCGFAFISNRSGLIYTAQPLQ